MLCDPNFPVSLCRDKGGTGGERRREEGEHSTERENWRMKRSKERHELVPHFFVRFRKKRQREKKLFRFFSPP